ncbi:D-alanine-D-alanine ligase [Parelusimicrobium proximum]|uniref:D-alanine--D-alanine ligase family protein n=1 Tax=Parelusimicrobium proximum TaxID=3228953 RepID=UPI003D1672B4
MKDLYVAVLYGGKSVEHEVSVHSAEDVCRALEGKCNVVPVFIDKNGLWYKQEKCGFHQESDIAITPIINPRHKLITHKGEPVKADIFFSLLHGTNGEDGVTQGLLTLLDAPYVGCDVLSSALGMDKELTKLAAASAGAPVLPHIALRSGDEYDLQDLKERALKLGMPLFVKPNSLGSSVGVSKVTDIDKLDEAVKLAFKYDKRVLIEKGVDNAREIFCAVIEDGIGVKASRCGELVASGSEFFTYHAKYIDPNGCIAKVPADIDGKTQEKMRECALNVFKTLKCSSMGRIDFLLGAEGDFYFSEINSIPGMSEGSLYPQLWAAEGLKYEDMLEILIDNAIVKYKKEKTLQRERE